ncbi:MAG TPA: AcvB/VirJ family lysyl-phosphatidylglycerol hydrolase [Candidatus Polarisedimenticolia bacterium]|nr:AcvB/VirJ family lysyl-phosphatidylglycerol hydrolase [Candidatus Polarisedimenticolia bacterium]
MKSALRMEMLAVVLALPALLATGAARSDAPPPTAETPAPTGPPATPSTMPTATPEPVVATPENGADRIQPSTAMLRLRMGMKRGIFVYPAVPPVSPEALPVLFFSGDWGWKPVLQDTASYLSRRGRTVIGIDSTEYFSRQLEEPDWSRDLKTLRDFANEKAGRPAGSPVLLAGFTWGASMVPFMLNRGGAEEFAGALLIGPIFHSNRIYRVTLQMPTSIVPLPKDEEFMTVDEVTKMPPIPVVFMQGAQDMESAADALIKVARGPKQIVNVPGGDRQFRDVREIYFSLAAQALGWLEGKH